MLRRVMPYRLLGALLAVVMVLFLGKIHKHSFYAHFFRVTQEVEARNSHLLPAETALFSAAQVEIVVHVGGSLGLSGGAFAFDWNVLPAQYECILAPTSADTHISMGLRHARQTPATGPPIG